MRTTYSLAHAALAGSCAVAFGLLTGLTGCTRRPPLVFETAHELDAGTAHAPGVAVDPPTELPLPASSASSNRGLTVLSAPSDVAAARAVVRAFFDAVVTESADRIDALIDDAAWILTGSSGRQKARAFWHARLGALDYRALGGQVVYRDSDLQTYEADEVGPLTGRRSLGLTPRGDDVLVRVAIVTPTAGPTRFFADEMLIVLSPRGSGFVIAEIAEDFRLP
jgi:hypothetical protein